MSVADSGTMPTLESLFVDAEALPSPPVAVLEIVRKADDPDVDIDEIVVLIERDVALAVQILRMANSALYSPVKEITTIERAITTLGLRSIRLVALMSSLRTLMPNNSAGFDTAELRRRMVINGSLAREFAKTLSPLVQDEAFLAGLMTGLGPVVLASQAPPAAEALFGGDEWPTQDDERELLGYHCNDITVGLMKAWGVPGILAEVVMTRFDPIAADDSAVRRCLKLATLAEEVLCGPDAGRALALLNAEMDASAEMSAEETSEWLVEREPIVSETARILEFDNPGADAYGALLVEATTRMQALTMEAHESLIQGNRAVQHLSQLNSELRRDAETDSLTKLPNRGSFDRLLDAELAACSGRRATDRRLGLLMIDLDHFKSINDTHGHAVGDDVLRALGELLEAQTRDRDLPARFGGEEFAVLLPNTINDELRLVAERLRAAVASIVITLPDGEGLSVTASIGAAINGETGERDSARSLIERADQRLYEAKHAGRNRAITP